jgi:dihydroorotate dehydrogenase
MQLYDLVRPLLFRMRAESAHGLITKGLDIATAVPGSRQIARRLIFSDPILATSLCGINLANPLGLAAGFDKDGRHVQGMAALGFGFLELGTVTPQPQPGNPQPRLFRLAADRALINRMGFNNAGAAALAARLKTLARPVPLGLNLGKNKLTPNERAADDYVQCLRLLGPYADYIVVNISSPNTPGLRELSRREPLEALLQAVQAERGALSRTLGRAAPPLFVKLSPDEDGGGLDAALGATLASGADGLIATNTTVSRVNLRSAQQKETGGLSGAPLHDRALATLRYLYAATAGAVPIIGVGGIDSGQAAYERIRAGASALQIYTALVYGGPGLVSQINRDLAALLRRDGFDSLGAAVGQAE